MDKNKVSVYDMLRAAEMVIKDYDDNNPKPLYFDAENTISDIERMKNKDE